MVRIVIELPETKLIYGSIFEVLETIGDKLKLKPIDATSPGVQSVPAAWTKPTKRDFQPIPIVNLERAARTYKQDALEMACISNPQLHGPIEKLSLKCAGPSPNWDHIELGLSQLRLSFDELAKPGSSGGPSSLSYLVVPLDTTHTCVQALSEGDEAGPEGKDLTIRFGQFLKHVVQHRKLLLVPICRGGHYTLLAACSEVSGVEVRYYDGLDEVSQPCWEAAEIFCKGLGVSMPPTKTNVSSQIGAECGICLLHWAEGELRKLHGEEVSIIGWPDLCRMSEIRKRVAAWCVGLENERKRWAMDKEKEQEERDKRAKAWLKAIEEAQKLNTLSEEAAADARALGEELSNAGASVSPLDVPEDFKVALRRLQQVRKHQANLREEILRIKEAELSIESDPKQWALDALAGKEAQEEEEDVKEDKPQEPPEAPENEDVNQDVKPPDAPEKKDAKQNKPKKPRTFSRKQLDKQLKLQAEFQELKDWDWRTELIEDKQKMAVYRVLKRPDPWRLCSKCSYKHGCLSCDADKALRYHLVKQGWAGPGAWDEKYIQGR